MDLSGNIYKTKQKNRINSDNARTKDGWDANIDQQGVPLYAHVSDLAGSKKPYVLPVPFMNVLNGG